MRVRLLWVPDRWLEILEPGDDQPLLSVVHKGCASGNAVAHNRPGYGHPVDVETFDPVVVLHIDGSGILVVEPDSVPSSEQGQQDQGFGSVLWIDHLEWGVK